MTTFTGPLGAQFGTRLEKAYGSLDTGALNQTWDLVGEGNGQVEDAEIVAALLQRAPDRLTALVKSVPTPQIQSIVAQQRTALETRAAWAASLQALLYSGDNTTLDWQQFALHFPRLYAGLVVGYEQHNQHNIRQVLQELGRAPTFLVTLLHAENASHNLTFEYREGGNLQYTVTDRQRTIFLNTNYTASQLLVSLPHELRHIEETSGAAAGIRDALQYVEAIIQPEILADINAIRVWKELDVVAQLPPSKQALCAIYATKGYAGLRHHAVTVGFGIYQAQFKQMVFGTRPEDALYYFYTALGDTKRAKLIDETWTARGQLDSALKDAYLVPLARATQYAGTWQQWQTVVSGATKQLRLQKYAPFIAAQFGELYSASRTLSQRYKGADKNGDAKAKQLWTDYLQTHRNMRSMLLANIVNHLVTNDYQGTRTALAKKLGLPALYSPKRR